MATLVTAKVIDTGISAKHARNWTVANAMRELVQNWLDVRNEFSCKGSISYRDGIATIKDLGPGLQMKHFAFGENDKAAGSIGQFGEGMKSAFIVLVRNNYTVEIRSNGMIVHPEIRFSDTFGTDTLHYNITPMAARHAAKLHGTVIHTNCSEEDLNAGKSYFVELIRQEGKGAAKKAAREGRQVTQADRATGFQWIERNKISLPAGFIYIKGSVIGTVSDALFSYHLDGVSAEQATNRDRDAVNMNVIKPMITEMIQNTSSTKVIEAVLKSIFDSSTGSSFESKLSLRCWSQAKIWHRVWNKMYGENWRVSTNSSNDRQAEYRGLKVIYNLGWDSKSLLDSIGVKDTSNFTAKAGKRVALQVVGPRSLNADELANLKWAKKMVTKYYSEPGKVVVAEDLAPISQSVYSMDGLWVSSNETVYLRRSVLSNRGTALHVLLHEVVHKVSGERDETAAFERALLQVAVDMISNLNKS